jgi:DNA-binding CsgD family transcriptional regulator
MVSAARKRQNLTEREKQLTKLALEGLSNGQIAEIVGTSENTIKYEFRIIYQKMRIKNRNQLKNTKNNFRQKD